MGVVGVGGGGGGGRGVSSFYCYYKQNKHDTRPLPCGDVASLVQKTERNAGQSQQHLEESHTLWTQRRPCQSSHTPRR